jgi:hypothetical protein
MENANWNVDRVGHDDEDLIHLKHLSKTGNKLSTCHTVRKKVTALCVCPRALRKAMLNNGEIIPMCCHTPEIPATQEAETKN